jgi:hypothetical protein
VGGEGEVLCAIQVADLDGDGVDELFVEKATPTDGWRVLGVLRKEEAKLVSLRWQGLGGRVFTARGGTDCKASYHVTPAAEGTRELVIDVSGGTPSVDCGSRRYHLTAAGLVDENGKPPP